MRLGRAHSEHIDPDVAAVVFAALPRRNAAKSLADDIAAHAAADQRCGPRYTFGGEISHEVASKGTTEFEVEVAVCVGGP